MTMTSMLEHGVVVTWPGGDSDSAKVIDDGGVVWEGDRIRAVGTSAELRGEFAPTHVMDARGGVIMPGLVNLHHHFYSALARGLDPGTPMTTFPEVLDRLWWRLDRALDPETVRISAELALADSVRWGCTTVFDHHASPSCIEGSLDLIAHAVAAVGLSAVLCYEVTDRNGRDGARAGVDENLRFLAARASDPRVRGVFGLHASFTLRDETLADVAGRRPAGAGCHVHVAEDPIDNQASLAAFGAGAVERLERYGLLDQRALLAHGIHLEREGYETIARADATIIHNPESNANNGVGRLDVARVGGRGCQVGLGTDGMSSAVLRSLRAAFLHHRAGTNDPSAGFDHIPDLLANNVRVARLFFDEPQLGELVPGAPADIIVVDAPPPTPVTGANFFGHLAYGLSEAPVRHTIARGRVLLEDGRHATVDVERLAARAREVSPGLWNRFAGMPWGTSFLGD